MLYEGQVGSVHWRAWVSWANENHDNDNQWHCPSQLTGFEWPVDSCHVPSPGVIFFFVINFHYFLRPAIAAASRAGVVSATPRDYAVLNPPKPERSQSHWEWAAMGSDFPLRSYPRSPYHRYPKTLPVTGGAGVAIPLVSICQGGGGNTKYQEY